MSCYSTIPSDSNTLKSITVCYHFLTEFASTYYNGNGDAFRYCFGKYIQTYMKEIDQTIFIQEWKLNLDIASYLKKLDKTESTSKKKN